MGEDASLLPEVFPDFDVFGRLVLVLFGVLLSLETNRESKVRTIAFSDTRRARFLNKTSKRQYILQNYPVIFETSLQFARHRKTAVSSIR